MRTSALVLAVAIALGIAMRAPASANYVPPGSYSESCTSIQVNGDVLTASCQDINGAWHATQAYISSCRYGSFANNDGALACGNGGYRFVGRLPYGSWRATCNDASMTDGILQANCEADNGSWRQTTLNMADCVRPVASNANGNLECMGLAQAGGWIPNGSNWQPFNQGAFTPLSMPGGTWGKSCRNAYIQGGVLYAQCSNGYGGWQQAFFNLYRYPNAQLANDHGTLVLMNGPVYRYLQ
jgi:hypothetical protein